MNCTACGSELILTNVVPDDTTVFVALSITPLFVRRAMSRNVSWCSSKMVVRRIARPYQCGRPLPAWVRARSGMSGRPCGPLGARDGAIASIKSDVTAAALFPLQNQTQETHREAAA